MNRSLDDIIKEEKPEVVAEAKRIAESILETINQTAQGLNKAGVMDKSTLREFDKLTKEPQEK